jgi:hypothetical protein
MDISPREGKTGQLVFGRVDVFDRPAGLGEGLYILVAVQGVYYEFKGQPDALQIEIIAWN